VIRLENDDHCRRAGVEPLPHLARVGGRSERVEDHRLATRLDARRRHQWLPLETRLPRTMLDTPYPEACRHIAEIHLHMCILPSAIVAGTASAHEGVRGGASNDAKA